jgi:hypothetical protein
MSVIVPPLSPTSYEQCARLGINYADLLREVTKAHDQCLLEHEGSTSVQEHQGSCSAPACQILHTRRDELSGDGSRAVSRCQADVAEHIRQEQEDRARRAEAGARLGPHSDDARRRGGASRTQEDEAGAESSRATIQDLKQAYDARDEAREALGDPLGYLERKLLDRIVQDSGRNAAASPDDETVDFAHDRAKELGNMGVGNPFARAVREASMAELANVQKRTLRNLDDVANQIASFGQDPPPLPTTNPFAAAVRPPSLECVNPRPCGWSPPRGASSQTT